MYKPRVSYIWYILISISILLFFYVAGRMSGMEERASRFRRPAYTPDMGKPLHAAQRGLKTNPGVTERTEASPLSVLAEDVIRPNNVRKYEVMKTKENIIKRMQIKKANTKSFQRTKIKHSSVFSLADFKPGKDSKPMLFGLETVKSRLNYEFSDADDSIRANSMIKRVPKFDPNRANVMDMIGNIPVGNKVPVESARQILIATTWRSGSTFLGDLLNHYKGTFYYFEPLHYYSYTQDMSKLQNETSFLKSLYSCNFDSKNVGYLNHASKTANKFLFQNHNFRLWNSCQNLLPNNILCFMPDYLNKVCPLFPIKLIKTVRLRVRKVEKLLEDPEMNLKVIVLVRDPRGVYNSRSSGAVKKWCKRDMCANPEVGCSDLSDDIQAAFDLEARYPGKVWLVRYEDLSLSPEDTTMNMLNFLDLPFTEGIANFIDTHTSKEKLKVVKNKRTKKLQKKKNPYGTAKNSSATAFAWREKMSFPKIMNIQESCHAPMEHLGYKILTNEEDLKAEDLPIEKTAQQVWPF